MKRKTLYAGLTALLLTGTMSSMSYAANNDLFGERVPATAADRVVVINPDTTYVNVTGGDVVKFVVGNKTFTWDFDTAVTVGEFDLNRVAPLGALDHRVKIYIARDPTYFGGA